MSILHKEWNGKFDAALFQLYDDHFFKGQLSRKLKETNSKVENKRRLSLERYNRCCGILYCKDEYVIEVSKWAIARLRTKEMRLRLFEHYLIHLIMLLWKVHKPSEIHGPLFKRLAKMFNRERDELLHLQTSSSLVRANKTSLYTLTQNSCYMDSLLMILLKCDYYINAFFLTNVDLVKYKDETQRSRIKTLQCILYANYTSEERYITSDKIRDVLYGCYPDMKTPSGAWDFYSVSEIYDLIAHMFYKDLSLEKHTLLYIDKFDSKRNHVVKDPPFRSVFTFWEFMDSYADTDDQYTKIMWSKYNLDIIVFRNSGVPAIQNFGSLESETIKSVMYIHAKSYEEIYDEKRKIYYYYDNLNGKMTAAKLKVGAHLRSFKVSKARCFSEYILGGKYQMVGAVILHGTKPGESGGTHYTSFVRIAEFMWRYDDMGPIWQKCEQFPKSEIFYERDGKKPELYFYRKVL